MRDLATNTTLLVSRASGLEGAGANARAEEPAISADGRYVAFDSRATNLDPANGDAGLAIFERDVVSGTTALVSRADGAAGKAVDGIDASMSSDGTLVEFRSADKAVAGDTNRATDVYVRDVPAGKTTLVTGFSPDGISADKPIEFDEGTISGDGRYFLVHARRSDRNIAGQERHAPGRSLRPASGTRSPSTRGAAHFSGFRFRPTAVALRSDREGVQRRLRGTSQRSALATLRPDQLAPD